ncbi:MAG: efflux RND transporter periplasmic adaptor subunit, partial [Bacteroidetes bacterium]
MNKNIIYTVAAIIVLIAIIVVLYPGMLGKNGSSQHEEASSSTTEQKEVYTCPMHPSVISDRPGACPVCGMALVKKTAQKESSKSELAMLKGVSLSSTQRVIANISTTPVEYQTIEKEINAIGVVDVAEPLQAKISARFRGRIETLYANFTGEAVKQGQKLFDLYSPDLVSAEQEFLLALNAQSEIADALYSTEIQQRLISAARDRLRLTFGMTESQLVDIETSREVQPTISYFSPISGTVISKNVQEGEYVDEGSLLYQLADLSRVWAYLDVYEKDVRFLSLNQIVHISTESYPGEMFTGKITFIDPVLNPESRTVRIRTEFANPHNKLKPQMWVKAHIILPAKSALVVPTTAIL